MEFWCKRLHANMSFRIMYFVKYWRVNILTELALTI